jgi:hypothetical protein
VNNPLISARVHRFCFSLIFLIHCLILPHLAFGQAASYSRIYPMPKEDVDKALKELQAYTGQRLPTVDGFVAQGDRSLDRFERAFYQFSIDLLLAPSGATTVRVSAKITAWYADPDPSKSGYQVLSSNGRLELDLLDRLAEKFGSHLPASAFGADVQVPKPNIDYSTHLPRITVPSFRSSSVAAAPSAMSSSRVAGNDELDALRAEREAKQKRILDLNAELRSLQGLQNNQAQPRNLVVVKKAGTPVLARPAERSHVLFVAAEEDEFEFLDTVGEWVHVNISGTSRGYIRRSSLELPEFIVSGQAVSNPMASTEPRSAFRLEREETTIFPGDWEPLRGKPVKIYTVQPTSQGPKETNAQAKFDFALSLFRKFSNESAQDTRPLEGAVVIFDSADGGIIGSTTLSVRQMASGSLSESDFRTACFIDLPDAGRALH